MNTKKCGAVDGVVHSLIRSLEFEPWVSKILDREWVPSHPQIGIYAARIQNSWTPIRIPDNGWETQKKKYGL